MTDTESEDMRVALTTYDNPYDPIDDFQNWFIFDEVSGYHSTSYLGRIVKSADSLSTEENNEQIENAIDEIIRYDFQNLYRKVKHIKHDT